LGRNLNSARMELILLGFALGRSPKCQGGQDLGMGALSKYYASQGIYRNCVCYRIWIRDLSTITEPIYHLFKEKVKLYWGAEQN
jgi:hypothetical protein